MSLVVPDTARPSNLHFAADVAVKMVDSDVYNICDRIREISDRLYIVVASRPDEYCFVIMESCDDGVDRMVYKLKELDGRVIERLREMMAVPLGERLRRLEIEEHKFNEERREEDLEELYERLGRPMWTELERCGFIDGRGVSYPKRGPKRDG